MRLMWIKYYPPFKRYGWLVIDNNQKHHWFRLKKDAEHYFTVDFLN